MRGFFVATVTLLSVLCSGAGWAKPPIEAYGALPRVRSMALSPDGDKIAYILYDNGQEALFVNSLTDGFVGGARTDSVKARYVDFASSDHVILIASETTSVFGYRGRMEYSAAFVYDIRTNKIRQLLRDTEDLYPAQSGLGKIVGVSA